MGIEKQLASAVYQVDRPLHHELAMAAFKESFAFRSLSANYLKTTFQQLNDVFQMVSVSDPQYPSIQRPVDTFDLTNPYQAARVVEGCYRDLPSQPRAIACLRTIDRYCQFLKLNPTIHLPGQQALYLPDIYGAIESPVNLYTIPRKTGQRLPNHNFFERSEYKLWLRFTWSQIQTALSPWQFLKASQFHLMCVIAGEMGLRIQEVLGLNPEHFTLNENICLVVQGKGNKGSGYRKRTVPTSPLVNHSLRDFLTQFPRKRGEPLFQNPKGERLGKSTAGQWMIEAIRKVRAAGLPILIEQKGFGWHAFRRTATRLYLEQSSDILKLMQQRGWAFATTAANYIGDEKQKRPISGPPLYTRKQQHGD